MPTFKSWTVHKIIEPKTLSLDAFLRAQSVTDHLATIGGGVLLLTGRGEGEGWERKGEGSGKREGR